MSSRDEVERSARGATLRRRATSIGALSLLAPLLVVLAPVLVPILLVVDLVTAPRRLPSLRGYGFAVAYVFTELAGVVASCWLSVRFVGRRDTEAWIDAHVRLQARWLDALFRSARVLLGLRVTVDGDDALAHPPVLVFGRHVSLVDSMVAAVLLGVQRRYELRFVLKRELQVDPCLDIVGHRLRNHFVDRSSGDAAEIAAVGRLGDDLRDDTAVVLFPEGTRFSPSKRDRSLERLRDRDDTGDLLPLAEGLRHLLPPRPGGALALLDHAPHTDVVVFGHVGFEGLDTFPGLWRGVPFDLPVEVRARRYARAELPLEAKDRARWLFERWAELDDWIDDRLRSREERS
ncbi:MAG: lysophospholipid acyltransferase family protein [Actinomycetota bacterium]